MFCIAAVSPGMERPAGPVKLQSCQASAALLRTNSRPATAPLLAAVMPRDALGTLSSDNTVWMVDVSSRWLLNNGGPSSCIKQA